MKLSIRMLFRFSLPNVTDRRMVFSVIIAMLLSFGILYILAFILKGKAGKPRPLLSSQAGETIPLSADLAEVSEVTNRLPSLISLVSPISGKVSESNQTEDGSSQMPRNCCTIHPSEGKIYAPCDCTVSALADHFNALTLECAENTKLTIRIGSDSAKPSEKDFIPCCKAGDQVMEGDLLLSFDMDALDDAGYDYTVAIVLENAERYDAVKLSEVRKLSVGEHLMTLAPKDAEDSSPQ